MMPWHRWLVIGLVVVWNLSGFRLWFEPSCVTFEERQTRLENKMSEVQL